MVPQCYCPKSYLIQFPSEPFRHSGFILGSVEVVLCQSSRPKAGCGLGVVTVKDSEINTLVMSGPTTAVR